MATKTEEVVPLPIRNVKEPDVFETGDDIPEDQQKENVEIILEAPNESIEREKIVVKEAFTKFSDKNFDTSHQDYSDTLVRKRIKRGGFVANQVDYEMSPFAPKEETPAQRFHRLQYEVKNFLEELETKKEEKQESEANEKQSAVDTSNLAEELRQLQKLLQGSLSDEHTRGIVDPKYEVEKQTNLQQEITSKLLTQLKNFVNTAQTADGPAKSTAGNLVYELYFSGEHAKQVHVSKLIDLEQRLNAIEQSLGSNKSSVPAVNLLGTVASLRDKLALLSNPTQLDTLQRKAKTVSQDFDKLLEQKSKDDTQGQPYENKINEMFELMNRWDSVSQQLPVIVQRLQSLKSLHEESGSFEQSVKNLEERQENMSKLLKSNSDLMTQVNNNFQGNLTIIQNNVGALEKRFNEIATKLEQMGMETF